MSFSYPSFLWALFALTIPVIIHLFNFRKTTRIYFSNTRFLKQVKEETTQKRRLKQYLVLASRLLFLFFLVFAFAQPFLPAKEQLADQQSIVIYLDNSFSMSTPVREKTRALDEAIRMAQGILDLFPAEARYQLITNDFAPFSNSFKTKAEVSDLLSQARLSAISRSASEIIGRVKEKNVTLFWLSDFQKSTFGTASIDSTWQVSLVPLKLEDHANVFVDSVYLDNPFAIGGEKNTLKVILRNSSKKNVEGLVIKLSINGIQSGATSVNIEPNSFAEVPFDIATGKGLNKGLITFSDFPISFDNEFFFALNFASRLKVIEIKQGGPPSYIEKVFGNKDIFFFKSFTSSNLDYSGLASADLIVVNGIDKLDATLADAINSYKEKFGTLFIIPGTQPDLISYQKLVAPLLTKAPTTELNDLNKPDFRNPFFANVFEEKNNAIAMPRATQLISWGADRSAILQFKNGQPFLSQFGKSFLLASPLDKKFTDLFNHALFVPVMYRIAASGKRSEQPLYYSSSTSSITIEADSIVGEEPVKLVGGQELIPTQRNMNGKLQLELPKHALTSGFYYVINHRDTLGLLAFDLDKHESLLEQLKAEEATHILGNKPSISVFKGTSADAFTSEVKEKYLGKPLWKYAIMLALLFLLVEVLLLRFLK
ncbi:MAG: BatA domain-containing protein [Bacteroidetes bacterium]|nr:BatA domain-containing protein [Bacteroidota bacterium]